MSSRIRSGARALHVGDVPVTGRPTTREVSSSAGAAWDGPDERSVGNVRFRGGTMTCEHCNAAEQRGRYCVGCGKLLPPSPLPARRVRLAPRHIPADDTQPVLRFRVPPRASAETEATAPV